MSQRARSSERALAASVLAHDDLDGNRGRGVDPKPAGQVREANLVPRLDPLAILYVCRTERDDEVHHEHERHGGLKGPRGTLGVGVEADAHGNHHGRIYYESHDQQVPFLLPVSRHWHDDAPIGSTPLILNVLFVNNQGRLPVLPIP